MNVNPAFDHLYADTPGLFELVTEAQFQSSMLFNDTERPISEMFYHNGMKVLVSPLCTREVQVKRHKRNKRINKKWLKRYGTKTVEDALVMGNHTVFVSQRAYDALKDKVQSVSTPSAG